MSGKECLKNSFILGKERALELFPMLKRDKLKGAIVYYDGKNNDNHNIEIIKLLHRHSSNLQY